MPKESHSINPRGQSIHEDRAGERRFLSETRPRWRCAPSPRFFNGERVGVRGEASRVFESLADERRKLPLTPTLSPLRASQGEGARCPC